MTESVKALAGSLVDAPEYSVPANENPVPSGELGKDAFLKLLVAQLKYQDPLEPSSSEDFIATTAQFTVVEKLDELTQQGANTQLVNSLTTASTLIGREVTATQGENTVTAVVNESRIVNGQVLLQTEQGPISLNEIVSVGAPSAPIVAPAAAPAAVEPTQTVEAEAPVEAEASAETDGQASTPAEAETTTTAEAAIETAIEVMAEAIAEAVAEINPAAQVDPVAQLDPDAADPAAPAVESEAITVPETVPGATYIVDPVEVDGALPLHVDPEPVVNPGIVETTPESPVAVLNAPAETTPAETTPVQTIAPPVEPTRTADPTRTAEATVAAPTESAVAVEQPAAEATEEFDPFDLQ